MFIYSMKYHFLECINKNATFMANRVMRNVCEQLEVRRENKFSAYAYMLRTLTIKSG